MFGRFRSKALNDRLEQKWLSSGMTDCKSMPEFLLRLEILHIKVNEYDFEFLVEHCSTDPEFCCVMVDLVKNTELFDKDLLDLEFYIDYYMAMSPESVPDPMKFGRIKILDRYMAGLFGGKSVSEARFREFMDICADKADTLFDGKLEHIKSFKGWLAARAAGK